MRLRIKDERAIKKIIYKVVVDSFENLKKKITLGSFPFKVHLYMYITCFLLLQTGKCAYLSGH